MGTIGLGRPIVSGRNLEPSPPAITTAFMIPAPCVSTPILGAGWPHHRVKMAGTWEGRANWWDCWWAVEPGTTRGQRTMNARTDLYREALSRLERGERVALATVVSTSGSTPQKAGAALLILQDGAMRGTIGGGCVEADAWAAARQLMRAGESGLRTFTLADDPDEPGGDVCGGTMDVMFEVLLPEAGERAVRA